MSDDTPCPVSLAAGMMRQPSQVEEGLLDLLCAIEYGSHTLHQKTGHKEPIFWFNEETQGSINSAGLGNKGLVAHLEEDLPVLVEMHQGTECAIDESLAPLKAGDLHAMAELLAKNPHLKHVRRIVANGACPNHRTSEGLQPVLAKDPQSVEILFREFEPLRGYQRAFKIAPKTSREVLRAIVRLCFQYDIDIINGNTDLGSSVVNGVQQISQPTGGHAGKPLFEYAVDQSHVLHSLIEEEDAGDRVEVIGCGGTMEAKHVHGHLNAHAVEVQIATLFYQYRTRGVQNLFTELYA